MFSFFKRKPKPANQPVPQWANFFNATEYQNFIGHVEDYFRSKKIDCTIGQEEGVVNIHNKSIDFSNLGLLNVAQMCRQLQPKQWKAMVSEHFANMIRTQEFQKEFNEKVSDFAYVKPFIGVRLYNIDYIRELGPDAVVYRNIIDDIIAMLVFDLPTHVTNIKPEYIDAWNLTVEELFDLGIENIRANYAFHISKQEIDQFSIWFVQSDHFFTGNIIFDLAEGQQQLMGSKGALIGIPHRHAVLIYPIENLQIIKAINTLIPIISGMNHEGPGSISHLLYWYKDGQFMNLPYELTDKELKFIPPEAFIDLLNGLQRAN